MKKRSLILLLIIATLLCAKVPFNNLYLEIEKIRYEGDPELLKNTRANEDKLDKFVSYQKIWVNVDENSYLMIEEPAEGNDLIEKYGKMKYQDKHYTLDYSLNFAWDGTNIPSENIFDNYTTDVPNYKYYDAKLAKKVMITTADGEKRKAHIYAYKYLDPADESQTEAYIKEIKSSDMPEEAKEMEIKAAEDALDKKAVKYVEWIWVNDEKEELQMFLRKHELTPYMKLEYNVTKVVVNDENFDNDIFERTLSEFKVKEIKG